MALEEVEALERSLGKMKHVGSAVRVICNVASVLVVAIWAVMIGLVLYRAIVGEGGSLGVDILADILFPTLFLGWMFAFVRIVANVFTDMKQGSSPFNEKQVWRIRWLAIMMVLFAVLDSVFAYTSTTLFGTVALSSAPGPEGPEIKINIGALFMSLVLFCLSVVFEHGTLLQRLSDETA